MSSSSLLGMLRGESDTSGMLNVGTDVVVDRAPENEGLARLKFGGGNLVDGPGNARVLVPRLAGRDFEVMLASTTQGYFEEVEMVLGKFCSKNSETWRNYLSTRVARRIPQEDGTGLYIIADNVEPSYAPPAEIAASKRKSNAKAKYYTLAQLFTDNYVIEKYRLSVKFVKDMQLLAVSRPAEAAASFQEAMQLTSSVTINVTAGQYAKTVNQAQQSIYMMAMHKRVVDHCVTSCVIDDKLFMYEPGSLDYTGWHITGPLKYAKEVALIHRLAAHGGLQETMVLFGMETQRLGIEMNDGENWVSPFMVGHVGESGVSLPMDTPSETLEAMTPVALSRYAQLMVNVGAIMGRDGCYASAVQVDPRLLLVNEHVKQQHSDLSVRGTFVDGGIPVSSDLWAHTIVSDYEPWRYRVGIPGELVSVMFNNGSHVVMSAPCRIDHVDGLHVFLKSNKDITVGMSGGALVALSDAALIGIHQGVTLRHLVGVSFTDTMLQDLLEIVSMESNDSKLGVSAADAAVAQLKNRGKLAEFLDVADSLAGLNSRNDDHVGTAMAKCGKLYTTCQSTSFASVRVDTSIVPDVPFSVANGFFMESASGYWPGSGTYVTRKPQLYERVILVGKTGGEVFSTNETVVRQVTVGGKAFMVASVDSNGYSLAGCVVVSMQDCAVLGMFVRDTASQELGRVSLCTVLPEQAEEAVNVVGAVQRAFSAAQVSAWPVDELTSALTHTTSSTSSSGEGCDNTALAKEGASFLRYRLCKAMRAAGVPADMWANMLSQHIGSDTLVSLAYDVDLSRLLRVGTGVTLPGTSGAYADMVRALVAVLASSEVTTVVDGCLTSLGLLPVFELADDGSYMYKHLVRRPSELTVAVPVGIGDFSPITPVQAFGG